MSERKVQRAIQELINKALSSEEQEGYSLIFDENMPGYIWTNNIEAIDLGETLESAKNEIDYFFS